MGDFQDLTGCQFGELTVVRLYRKCANGGSTWHCWCSCGREVDLPASDLLKGRLTCGACNYGHYCFYPGYAECLLPNGNSFLIDIQDYPMVSRYKWSKTSEGYFSACHMATFANTNKINTPPITWNGLRLAQSASARSFSFIMKRILPSLYEEAPLSCSASRALVLCVSSL